MPKRRYYSFEKRQKELKREKKNEAKLERQRLKKEEVRSEQLEDEGEVAEGESVGEANLDNAGDPLGLAIFKP